MLRSELNYLILLLGKKYAMKWFFLFQSAHMAVIEALMQLFIKEQVSVERVLNTVKRFSAPVSTSEAPTDPDSALLLWTKRCCESLKLRIEDELKSNSDEVNMT